jgi:hypothetical protein
MNMVNFAFIIIELLLLYFLSSKTENLLYTAVYRLTKSKTVSLSILSVLIYPGVVVHELSHLVTAVILFVPVKKITLVPEKTGDSIRSGSVTIAQTDPVRTTLIGIAPLFVGIAMLWAVTMYLMPPLPIICKNLTGSFAPLRMTDQRHSEEVQTTDDNNRAVEQWNNTLLPQCTNTHKLITDNLLLTTSIALYLIFSLSTAMFSSKKDLEALKVLVPFVIVFIGILYLGGFQFTKVVEILNNLDALFQLIVFVLLIPVIVQVFILILVKTVFSIINSLL